METSKGRSNVVPNVALRSVESGASRASFTLAHIGARILCQNRNMAQTFGLNIVAQSSRSCFLSGRFWYSVNGKHLGNHAQQIRRCFSGKIDAKQIASLRKQTGYGLSLCREALVKNDSNIKAAEAWLGEQAVKQGWQKAEKLQERKTGEGLIGVMVENSHAAMVEVCCETDFVAQNDFFKDLVAKATSTALSHRKMIVQRGLDLGGTATHFREVLLTHRLNEMKLCNSEDTVADAVLQVVGRLGERIMLKRAFTMTTQQDCVIGQYTHGPFTFNFDNCNMGKYAALVTLQPTIGDTKDLSSLATLLCRHIVGMNPSCISSEDATNETDKADILEEQNYLMDDAVTIKDLLRSYNASIVDFVRMECAE